MGGNGEALWIPTNPTLKPFATIAFGLDRRQTVPCDSAKLFVSPASFDSFSQIGDPPITDLDNSFLNANDQKDLWKKCMSVSSPRKIPVRRRGERIHPQYRELQTDAMKAHKELDVFKKNTGNSLRGLDLKM